METRKRNLVIGFTAAIAGPILLAGSIFVQIKLYPKVSRFLSTASLAQISGSFGGEWDSGAMLMYAGNIQSDSWTVSCRKASWFKQHAALTFAEGQSLLVKASCGEGDDLRLYLYQQDGEEQCWDISALDEPLTIPLDGFTPGELKLRLETDGAENIEAAFTLQPKA